MYTGGIGSYALLVMIIASLRTHSERTIDGKVEHNLGALLLDFFELYGTLLQTEYVGVSADGFFDKQSAGMVDPSRRELFSVVDPTDTANDLVRTSAADSPLCRMSGPPTLASAASPQLLLR